MSPYGLLYSAAAAVSMVWAGWRLVRAGCGTVQVVRGLALVVWACVIGSFLFHYPLMAFNSMLTTGTFDATWGGSTVVGAILGGVLALKLYARALPLPWRQIFDIVCVPVPLSQAIGRLGCLHVGCCYGHPTGSWLGMELTDPDGVLAVRYPTQLMSSAGNLLILFTLLMAEGLRRQRGGDWPFSGFIFLLYIDLYCVKRFLIEFLRDTAPPLVGPLTWAHLACLVGLVMVSAMMVSGFRSGAEGRCTG